MGKARRLMDSILATDTPCCDGLERQVISMQAADKSPVFGRPTISVTAPLNNARLKTSDARSNINCSVGRELEELSAVQR